MVRNHHVHRIHKKKQKDKYDYLVYFFTVTTPLFELTQAYEIYRKQSAENVSVPMWLFFLVSDFVWLGYAIRHKLKPLLVMYIFYILVETSIVIGIFIYS
jgi:uncharacterized protein with PQ loop repeat